MSQFKMKVIGKSRVKPVNARESVEELNQLQKFMNELKQGRVHPKGLYKFKSFTEAHKWTIKTMASMPVSRRLKTS